MFTKDFINNDITSLSKQSKIVDALEVFHEHRISHIPIVERGKLIGMLPYEALLNRNSTKKIGELIDCLATFYGGTNEIYFITLKQMEENDTDIYPVLDENGNYLGCVQVTDILSTIVNYPFVNEVGVLLILGIPLKDYSMAQIAQIVEGYNAKILGSFIAHFFENKVEVVIKINTMEVSRIINSFKRYEYHILFCSEDNMYIQQLNERYSNLMKYLNL